jgi:hypothetical protein
MCVYLFVRHVTLGCILGDSLWTLDAGCATATIRSPKSSNADTVAPIDSVGPTVLCIARTLEACGLAVIRLKQEAREVLKGERGARDSDALQSMKQDR